MPVNFIESIRGLFNNEFVNKASSSLGESSGNIQKALGGIIPALLGGALAKSNAGNAADVLNMAKNALGTEGINGMLTSDTNSLQSKGMQLLPGLLANNTNTISNAVANYAGIKENTAHSLMAIATPLTLGKLGEHAQQNNMDASSLSAFLSSQKEHILHAMPPALNLGSLLGLGSIAAFGSKAKAMAGDTQKRITAGKPLSGAMSNWVWPVALLLIVGVAVWYFVNRSKRTTVVAGTTTTMHDTSTATAKKPVETGMAPARMATRVRLANGEELNAYAGGVEEKLVNCLNDAGCKAGKDKWFDFDNINFETGSAQLTSTSMAQVKNIVAVLKAYPHAKIKIGGYTDKTGNDAANQRLSQQRATAVMNAIKDAGGNTSQLLGAEGYGSSMAKVAATAPDEERRADRRISIQLREK